MSLTPEQYQLIRESTTDEAAFQRIVALVEDVASPDKQAKPSQHQVPFDLDQDQSELLQAVLNGIPVAVYIKDTNSRFVMANQRTLEMLNITSVEEAIGKTDLDLSPLDAARYHFRLEQEMLRTGEPIIGLEETFKDIHNDEIWVLITKSPIYDKSGELLGLIGINRDITLQKRAELSLQTEHNLLQVLIDHIHEKVYVKDRAGRFVMANASTLQAHRTSRQIREGKNYELKELIGTTDFDYMDHERAQQMFVEEQEIMQTGKPVINKELHTPSIVTGESDMWFLVTKVPFFDENGNVTGIVGINRDITTRKIAQQKIVELELEQERSGLLSDFITNTSHEFRTPISIIQTSTYMMQNAADPAKQAEYMARITQQTDRLTQLIDSLLFTSRLDRKQAIAQDIISLDSFLTFLSDHAHSRLKEKQLNIQLVADHTLDTIIADEELLASALFAIVDNAVYFTPDQGNITIRSTSNNEQVVIHIEDTGIGMTPEIVSKIFNRFYRADNAHSTSGFGLGLSIAKQIIELHNGQIEVESEVGSGTRFAVILPQA